MPGKSKPKLRLAGALPRVLLRGLATRTTTVIRAATVRERLGPLADARDSVYSSVPVDDRPSSLERRFQSFLPATMFHLSQK